MKILKTKTCARCKKRLSTNKFRYSSKDGHQSYCIKCNKEYKQKHWQEHSKGQVKRRKELWLLKTLYILKYFKTHHCIDCSESDPIVLDFDHLHPEQKIASIAMMAVTGCNIQSMITEINVLF